MRNLQIDCLPTYRFRFKLFQLEKCFEQNFITQTDWRGRHNQITCAQLQCDQIGLFLNVSETNFLRKVAQTFCNILGYFDKCHFLNETSVGTFRKIGILFIWTSGHAALKLKTRAPPIEHIMIYFLFLSTFKIKNNNPWFSRQTKLELSWLFPFKIINVFC